MPSVSLGQTVPQSRNLELKVKVGGDALTSIRAALAVELRSPVESQGQDDSYYTVPEGRLKLRTIRDDGGGERRELIAYRRDDVAGSRWSSYHVLPLSAEQGATLGTMLEQVMHVWVRVSKQREVWRIGATRIHLDTVEGLGEFVELETVMSDQSRADAEKEYRAVTEWLGLAACPVIAGSYSDLLATR